MKTSRNAATQDIKSNSPQDNQDSKSESIPLLTSSIIQPNSFLASDEYVTFADIPLPGLWKEDEAGKHTDRIIILLFILLASMIVVSA